MKNIIKALQNHISGQRRKAKRTKQLAQLMADVPETRANLYKVLLENELNYIDAASAMKSKCPKCGTVVSSDSKALELLPEVALETIHQIMLLDEVVGIQPLQGPVGLVYTLQYKVQDDNHALLEICSQAVEARSQRLKASWTLETAVDTQTLHGVDIEQEVCHALGHESGYEVLRMVLDQLYDIAGEIDTESQISKLTAVNVNAAASTIAQQTRRGPGNFVIVSADVLASMFLWPEYSGSGTKSKNQMFAHAGDLKYNEQHVIKVFVDVGAAEGTLLVGYKGSNCTDAGVFYSPYILLMSSGMVVDPITFEPRVSFLTRYGMFVDEKASSYYIKLKMR